MLKYTILAYLDTVRVPVRVVFFNHSIDFLIELHLRKKNLCQRTQRFKTVVIFIYFYHAWKFYFTHKMCNARLNFFRFFILSKVLVIHNTSQYSTYAGIFVNIFARFSIDLLPFIIMS